MFPLILIPVAQTIAGGLAAGATLALNEKL